MFHRIFRKGFSAACICTLAFLFSLTSTHIYSSVVPKAIKIGNAGLPSNRISMVYVAEGYTQSELPLFAATVEKAVHYRDTATMAEPYKRYRNFFISYRIDLPSVESGITHSGEAQKNTALLGFADTDRLGTVDDDKLNEAVVAGMQGIGAKRTWHYAVMHDTGYFNSGGGNACTFSEKYWGETALHEGGHAFYDLGDEYGGPGTGTGKEPRAINITADATGKKWSLWNGYIQPIVGENRPFEGGQYVDHGVFRPSQNSKMNQTYQSRPAPFNMISIEKIIHDIYAIVSPLDSTLSNQSPLVDPDKIWVKTVDPNVLWVDWSVDGKVIKTNGGEVLALWEIPGLAHGSHLIKAHIYDEVVIHSGSDNSHPHALDWVRSNLEALQMDVDWQVTLTKTIAIAPQNKSKKFRNNGNLKQLRFELVKDGSYRIGEFALDGQSGQKP
jgi:hypothetical protein